MKRFIAVLSGLLFLPAFAEVAPVYYDEIVEYTDELIDEAEEQPVEEEATKPVVIKKPVVVQRNVAGRSVSRAVSAGSNTNSRTNTGTRTVASSPRNATQTPRGTVSRTAKTQTVSARPQTATRARATVASRTSAGSARANSTSKPVAARVAATGSIMSGARTNSGTPSVLTDSGDPLYISNNTARIGVNRRSAANRNISADIEVPTIDTEAVEETTATLDALAELTDYCKAQYAQCMDNYCNVLDDNQGRCSCSNNIKKYEKNELALEEASENFQDVVQKIKYIGLTASQIDALFTETEGELKMKSTSDTSSLKSSLENIKKKIVDVSTGKASTGLLDGMSFDMSGLLNTDFSSGFDLNSFLNTGNNVSNQRGVSLYNTATQRCKTSVLNSCVAQGVDSKVITNSYDLAIDKQCVEYERSLNEANAEMRNNVRNAQNILQQARLMLVQQKNTYDLRGCVAALDECMQDEYVCGDEYELCLDPTGKYLASGEIVKGGMPGIAGGTSVNQNNIPYATGSDGIASALGAVSSNGMYGLYSTWNYGAEGNKLNAWGKGTGEDLNGYINDKVTIWAGNPTTSNSTSDIATYLLRRIGYVDDKNENQTYGMCANVLKQCQNYTFDKNKKYMLNNDVVRQYLALALTKIKLKQDTILADYAETCWNDVYSCLSTNNYDENSTGSIASKTAVNACRSEVSTCMSVTGFYPTNNQTLTLQTMMDWVSGNIDPDWSGVVSPCQSDATDYHPEICSNSLVAYRCLDNSTYQYKCGCGYGIVYSGNDLAAWNTTTYGDSSKFTKLTVTNTEGTTTDYVGVALTDNNGKCMCPVDMSTSYEPVLNSNANKVLQIKNQNYDKVNSFVGCK